MEVYHRITPVRTVQQSIQLIKSLRAEQKEIAWLHRPKTQASLGGHRSNDYGLIPKLRENYDVDAFLPMKHDLARNTATSYTLSQF